MPEPLAWLVNVALFVPLGWLGHGAARRLGLLPLPCVVFVLLAAGVLSVTLETVQYVVANRHGPRWTLVTRHGLDVVLHLLGALAGALGAARLTGRRV
jgi:glycopeptide antibiotics resistance protein